MRVVPLADGSDRARARDVRRDRRLPRHAERVADRHQRSPRRRPVRGRARSRRAARGAPGPGAVFRRQPLRVRRRPHALAARATGAAGARRGAPRRRVRRARGDARRGDQRLLPDHARGRGGGGMTGRLLARRTFLRGTLATGAGVAVGLPMLDAMMNLGGTAMAGGKAPPQRFILWFWGNGTEPGAWAPPTTGPG